ncbi:MAG: hypothetical protein P1U83_18825 [Roseovarius sp.]|nr:hypothetical protein [Roseovarius sp.]
MTQPILHKAKADKHQRLFDLIRQGNLAGQAPDCVVIPSATVSAEVQAFRKQAEQSLMPSKLAG